MRISSRLDIELRNSLTHFTFRDEGADICYYNFSRKGNEWITCENRIKSSELFQKMEETSLIRAILGCLIVDWYGL